MRLATVISGWTHRQAGVVHGCVLLAALALAALPAHGQATSGAHTIGVFRSGWQLAAWWVDSNGSHAWEPSDGFYYFGLAGDTPVMGDWTFSGQRRMGIFRAGIWYADTDDSRSWTGGDSMFAFGLAGDRPLTISLDDGRLHLAVFRPSECKLYVDTSQLNTYDPVTTYVYQVVGAESGDIPVMVNVDGQGGRLAFYRPGTPEFGTQKWYFGPRGADLRGLYQGLNTPINVIYAGAFGMYGDQPVAGDWTGTGTGVWNIGVYRAQGIWAFDSNGSLAWEGTDAVFDSFGLAGDLPVMGPWASQTPPQYCLTTSSNPPGGGSVTLAPPSGCYNSGTVVTVDANPNSGYQFSHLYRCLGISGSRTTSLPTITPARSPAA